MTEQRILIPVDDTDATVQALDHVVARFASTPARCVVMHVVGPVPPGLLESGGSADSVEEQRMEAELSAEEARWFHAEQEKVRPLMESCRKRLEDGGIAPDRISVHVAESLPEDRLANLILEEARHAECNTIVVARHSYSWLAEKFHRHVGDELKKHAGDIEIDVVNA